MYAYFQAWRERFTFYVLPAKHYFLLSLYLVRIISILYYWFSSWYILMCMWSNCHITPPYYFHERSLTLCPWKIWMLNSIRYCMYIYFQCKFINPMWKFYNQKNIFSKSFIWLKRKTKNIYYVVTILSINLRKRA